MWSSGTVGNAVRYFAPQLPHSSPVCQTKSSERRGRGPAATASAIDSSATTPESVIVCAVVDVVATRLTRAGHLRGGVASQVIEVRAEGDVLVLEDRVAAFDHGDDVHRVLELPGGGQVHRQELPRFEGKQLAGIVRGGALRDARAVLALAAEQVGNQAAARR